MASAMSAALDDMLRLHTPFRPVEYAPDVLSGCPGCGAWAWLYGRRFVTRLEGVTTVIGVRDVVRCGECGAEADVADVQVTLVGMD